MGGNGKASSAKARSFLASVKRGQGLPMNGGGANHPLDVGGAGPPPPPLVIGGVNFFVFGGQSPLQMHLGVTPRRLCGLAETTRRCKNLRRCWGHPRRRKSIADPRGDLSRNGTRTTPPDEDPRAEMKKKEKAMVAFGCWIAPLSRR